MRIRDVRKSNWFWVENVLIDRADLNVYEKMIYIVFCRFANQNNTCYPSLQTIAAAAGCSKRKAADVINSLVYKKNLIFKTLRKTCEGDLTSNEYTVLSAYAEEQGIAQHAIPPAQYATPVAHAVQRKNTDTKITTTTPHPPAVVISSDEEKVKSESSCNGDLQEMREIIAGTDFKKLTDSFVRGKIKRFGFDHVAKILKWAIIQYKTKTISNPPALISVLLSAGMDKPVAVKEAEDAAQAEIVTTEMIRQMREERERVREEGIPQEIKQFISQFIQS